METSIPTENYRFSLPALVTTSSADETLVLGRRLASLLGKGAVVAITGPLGAGKTNITKGIALALGVTEEVTSPTYTIVSEYEAAIAGETIAFFHIDAYRLRGDDDFSSVGGEDIIFGNGISVIEWSDRIPGFISDEAVRVDIEITGETERRFRVYRKEDCPSGENDR